MVGGFSDAKPVDDRAAAAANAHRAAAETQLGKTFTKWTPVAYAHQVVAGTNLLVKVSVDDGLFVHLKVFLPLPHTGAASEVR
jgi:hypothetical protein